MHCTRHLPSIIQNRDKDRLLASKIESLQSIIPKDLGIPYSDELLETRPRAAPEHSPNQGTPQQHPRRDHHMQSERQDGTKEVLAPAIAELQKMSKERSLRGKLNCLLETSRAIVNALASLNNPNMDFVYVH